MRFLTHLLAILVAVVGLSIPAPATADTATCTFDVGNAGYDVTFAVPRTVFGGGWRCVDLRSEIRLGPATQQSGPYDQSTEWSWEFCVYVFTPHGVYEWCARVTIRVSTTIPGIGTIDVDVLRANRNVSPARFCWQEKLPGGTIATHCFEITIEIG